MTVAQKDVRHRVGEKIGTSGWFDMTQSMIDAHADTTQDWQFIHVDPEKAAETPFGGTIAHGFLTLSMLSAMAYQIEPEIQGVTHGVNYGLNRLRFVAPVPAGARIRAHFTLTDLVEKPGELTLTWGVEMEIEGNPKPALVAEWINRRYLEHPQNSSE